MKIQDFLKHHGVARNPFSEEDAQTDIVFKDHCIGSTFHVGWDKVYGDPNDPSTSIVFGEKGAGKTALKLQIGQHVEEHNKQNPTNKVFVVEYDDFNPYLDRFRDHFGSRFRRPDKLLGAWRLWDHMDAILSLGVTKLADEITAADGELKKKTRALPSHLRRDMLLLAACYDQSKTVAMPVRWNTLRSNLGFWTWKGLLPGWLGIFGLILAAALFLFVTLYNNGMLPQSQTGATAATTAAIDNGDGTIAPTTDDTPAPEPAANDAVPEESDTPPATGGSKINIPGWVYIATIGLAWIPWVVKAIRRMWLASTITRRVRVNKHYTNSLRRILMNFTSRDLLGQPFPNKDRTDDRYELLGKFQNILEQLDYTGVIVMVDRLDEPHMINGQAELMRAFLWPILDNKFLKHPGIGIKMMLPIELRRFVDREDRDFYQRSRLDKQNMIPSLQWTGSALYDLANSRLTAVANAGKTTSVRALFDEAITDERLISGFQSLRTPRHLFKFLYRLLVSHCNSHTDENPRYEVTRDQFESVLAVYAKDIEAADAGVGI